MPNPAETAVLESLWPGLVEVHGVTIAYFREGVQQGTAFTAVKDRSETQIVTASYTETVIADDWVVQKSDLVARSVPEPKRGDRIQWTDSASVLHTFEVQMPSADRQWSKVDPFGLLLRIHSKEIKP